MKKKCTNNKCRKVFVVKAKNVKCPYCGKKYPRLKDAKAVNKEYNMNDRKLLIGTSSRNYYKGVRISGRGCPNTKIRLLLKIREWTGKGLLETKKLIDSDSFFIGAEEISNNHPKMAKIDSKRGLHIESPLKGFTKELDELGCLYEVVT